MNFSAPNQTYDLCGEMIGLAMKVHRKLGFGFLESVYLKALTKEIKALGKTVGTEIPIKVWYDGEPVGDFYADLIVENKLIIELKAIEKLAIIHEVQLVNYLNATAIEHGLLLNFGAQRLEFKKKFRRPLPRGDQFDSVNSV